VHDRQDDRIGRTSVEAKESAVGGSSKGKDNTLEEPIKNKDIRRIRIIPVNS
jgi:hypothetical protein